MATAGFERGLMLRSPARFQATARAAGRALPRERGALPIRRCATRSCARWMDAEAYASTPTGPRRGCSPAARSAPRRASTRSSGRRWTCACTRPRSRSSARAPSCCPRRRPRGDVGDWLDGFLFSLAGPIYAGTNEIQRNVIAERMLGLPQGVSRCSFAFTEDQLAVRRRACATFLASECTPDARARALGRRETGRSPELWSAARRARRRSACSCPRRTAASGWTSSTRAAARGGRPRGARRAARRDRRRRACRCSPSSATRARRALARAASRRRGDRSRSAIRVEPVRRRRARRRPAAARARATSSTPSRARATSRSSAQPVERPARRLFRVEWTPRGRDARRARRRGARAARRRARSRRARAPRRSSLGVASGCVELAVALRARSASSSASRSARSRR